jgi:hypothetical protein
LQFSPAGDKLAAVFWPRDWNDFPRPGRPLGTLWSFSSQVRVYDLAAGSEVWRANCDRVLVPTGRDWLATQTNSIPPTGEVDWDILGYDGNSRPGGAAFDGSERPVSDLWGRGGRLLALAGETVGPWSARLARVGLRWPFGRTESVRFVDVQTGEVAGILPAWSADRLNGGRGADWAVFAPTDDLVAVMQGGRICIWDIPPRTSLMWFGVVAAAFALPLARLARRRVRKLCPKREEHSVI